MIPRYTPADFAELWSAQTKYRVWLDVELAACRAMEGAGWVPKGTAESLAPLKERLDAGRIEEIEKTTHHDVIAFLTHVEELGGPAARWLHRGMTSSDVLDSSLALLLKEAATRSLTRLDALLAALARRIDEHRLTPMMGRSHGIQAEPLTFGLVLAGHYAELQRARRHLSSAREEIAVGKIAGAVGTYAHLTPEVEAEALASLGLRPESASTQVVARDRHAFFLMSLSLVAAAIERFATNVRHWQRSEVGEAEERFSRGQKGSSAMPHKRNPISSENLCGLSRVVRAAVVPGLENIALWHERDISHSSVERMLFPDATATLAFMIERCTSLVEGLVVRAEKMRVNLDASRGLWASEAVMLKLVAKGLARQRAYEMVQRNAMKTFLEGSDFVELLCSDADIQAHLHPEEIHRAFELEQVFSHVNTIIDRVLNDPQ